MTSLRQRFTEDMQIRNLAVNTQESYVRRFRGKPRGWCRSTECSTSPLAVIIILTKGSPSLISLRKPGTPASSSLPTTEQIGPPRRKSARPCSRAVFSATPFFVQHGQDGRGRTNNGGEYIYATSSDGVWNNGSGMILGRVRRDQIARLDARDWEFCHGFDEQQQPIWRPRHDTALYTFHASGRASMTGIHRLEPLDIYIMPQCSYD
jgi:hypothetical protein